MKRCDWCREWYDAEAVYATRCGLLLCPLCRDAHAREGCDDCTQEAGFEAADYDWDKARDT